MVSENKAALEGNLFSFLKSQHANGQLGTTINSWKYLLTVTPPLADIKPFLDYVSALLTQYGDLLSEKDQIDEALSCYGFALQASDTNALAILNNAAICLGALGRLNESISAYQNALRIDPGYRKAQDALLLSLHYRPELTWPAIAQIHADWNKKSGMHAYQIPHLYANDPNPERPLRVGIISGDLWMHSVGVFIVRFLEHTDYTRYTFKCYSIHPHSDALTERIRSTVALWDDVENLGDEELAQKIQADGIDILIDLGGHTGKNRLPVFARKPAPVQISWLGYPGPSGLSTMDYVIGDRYVLPASAQPFMNARILNLPDSFACFDPPLVAPPVSPLPAKKPGQITFGCFNNPMKCNEQVIKVWAEILRRLPQSKLLFKYRGFGVPSAQKSFATQFAAYGIDPSRLIFKGTSTISKMFAEIADTDIALDPFPFAGGTMTCMTLWMGVPVLTLPGESFASRQGLSFMRTIGITDTIANDAEDYCYIAVALAHDLSRLAEIRKRLRPAMAASPLCDGAKAATGLQNLLRTAWREWCIQRHTNL